MIVVPQELGDHVGFLVIDNPYRTVEVFLLGAHKEDMLRILSLLSKFDVVGINQDSRSLLPPIDPDSLNWKLGEELSVIHGCWCGGKTPQRAKTQGAS